MGKHRAPVTPASVHPWLRRVTAGVSILILIATSLGGGAVYAINSLGKNINALDTSDLNIQDPIVIQLIRIKTICFSNYLFFVKKGPFASKILAMAQKY